MLKHMLASICVNFPLHIPYVPGIISIINISTNSSFNKKQPPTYDHLNITLLIQK